MDGRKLQAVGRTCTTRPLVSSYSARTRNMRKLRTLSFISQGSAGPMRSRADFHATLRKFRDVKQEAAEAGHEFNPTVRPRKRRGQQFQQHKRPYYRPRHHRKIRSGYKQCGPNCRMVSSSEERLDMVAMFYIMVVVFHDMVVIYRVERVVSTFVVQIFLQGFRLQAIAMPLQSTEHLTHANIFSHVAQGGDQAPARFICVRLRR